MFNFLSIISLNLFIITVFMSLSGKYSGCSLASMVAIAYVVLFVCFVLLCFFFVVVVLFSC